MKTASAGPDRLAQRAVMRAALLVDVNQFDVRDVPAPAPGAHDVLVRVTAVGLCGTDAHIAAGHANYTSNDRGRPIPLREQPQILGHEIAGVIEDVGSAVDDFQAGDRVVLDQGRNCRSERRTPMCDYCTTGDSHQCQFYKEHGITGLPGGFAEFISIPAVNAIGFRAEVAHEHAALTEPLGCVLHAAAMLDRARARFSLAAGSVRAIVVFGAGPAGLLFIQLLRNVLKFDGRLLVSEPNRTKRALAERFGATAVDSSDVAGAVAEHTHGQRADLVIDASGAGAVIGAIPGVLRKQGTVLLYGHGHAGVDMSMLNQVQFLEPTLIAPAGASGGFEPDGRPSTYVRALRHIERGDIDVGSLITHRYVSIDSVPAAFADFGRPDYVKGVITL